MFVPRLSLSLSFQVHDEVILEGPEETAKEALAETVRCMQEPWDGVGLKELRVSFFFFFCGTGNFRIITPEKETYCSHRPKRRPSDRWRLYSGARGGGLLITHAIVV